MNCPVCKRYFDKKDKTVDHIEREHMSQLPTNMNAEQYLYYSTHGTVKGLCMCGCSRETEWNYKTGKPYKLTNDPECKKRLREAALVNHRRTYGKDTLLNDPEHQKKMVNNRSISGVYKFSDGSEQNYVGSYELSFLKFCDKVLDMDSKMVMDCPYVFEYMDDNTKRFYIPDKYLPDYNLVVEVKEGGKNPNMNPGYLQDTKKKEKLKDDVMLNQKEYNYIKVIDNNFGPFLKILFDIKANNITDKDNKNKFVIVNESITTFKLPSKELYLVVVRYNGINNIDTIGITDTVDLSYMYIPILGKIHTTGINNKYFDNKNLIVSKYIGRRDSVSLIFDLINKYIEEDESYTSLDLLALLEAFNIIIDPNYLVSGDESIMKEFIEISRIKIETKSVK